MLQKLMIGRLGNQMFQYAVARALHEQFDPTGRLLLVFPPADFNAENGRVNQLSDFSLPDFVEESSALIATNKQRELLTYLDRIYGALYEQYGEDRDKYIRHREIQLQPYLNAHGICSMMNGYYPFSITVDTIITGYLETADYFDRIKPLIQQDFTPKHPPLAKNLPLYHAIRSTNSVCVSIRRGDFVNDPAIRTRHHVCTEAYFEKAIQRMNSLIPNPQYIFFSDDIQWVKANIPAPAGSLYEDGSDPVWEKLRLMYECKHFIISNSTFSWWAQYLSRNEKKIVIAPSRWLNQGSNPDIYQNNWLLIDV